MSKDLLAKRKLPQDYASDVLGVLRLMSFTNLRGLELMGSAELKAQLYAGDYDAYERVQVRSLASTARKFQSMIKKLLNSNLTYIGDIKMGSVEEWKVIGDEARIQNGQVRGYEPKRIKAKVEALYNDTIISRQERDTAFAMLKSSITPYELLEIKRDLRFNILRWTPQEVLKGYKYLQDGRRFTLEEAITSPTIAKLDCISWVQGNRFTEFSVIYEFYKGKKLLNGEIKNVLQVLKESTYQLYHEKNYYKMAKRLFSIARLERMTALIPILSNLFNGDLGRLYIIYGDLGTLEYMLENYSRLPRKKVEFELDQFRNRLANITLPKYLREEPIIISTLDKIERRNEIATNNAQMLRLIRHLKDEMMKLLSYYSYEYLRSHHLIPVPRQFLP
jgi:hypothetical protein